MQLKTAFADQEDASSGAGLQDLVHALLTITP